MNGRTKLPDMRRTVRTQATKAFGRALTSSQHPCGVGRNLEVASCAGSPVHNAVSYTTVGLCNHGLFQGEDLTNIRIEFVSAAYKSFEGIGAALASAAARVIDDRWFCAPGVVFPDILELGLLWKTLCDFYFIPPFLWGERPTDLDLGGMHLAWLLAVPIARSESVYAQARGGAELEDILEAAHVDMLDWNRTPVA